MMRSTSVLEGGFTGAAAGLRRWMGPTPALSHTNKTGVSGRGLVGFEFGYVQEQQQAFDQLLSDGSPEGGTGRMVDA